MFKDRLHSLKWVGILFALSNLTFCLGDFGTIFVVANGLVLYSFVQWDNKELVMAKLNELKAVVEKLVGQVIEKIPKKAKV